MVILQRSAHASMYQQLKYQATVWTNKKIKTFVHELLAIPYIQS